MGGTVADASGPMSFSRFGLPRRAAADFARAEQLFAATGQELEYAMARHNRGLVALIRGDLPEALAYLDEAGSRYDALGVTNPDLAIDRCSALLAAGLAAEAAQETETALSQVPRQGEMAYRKAELLFVAATAALAAGDPANARERARQARRLFRTQRAGHLGGARRPRPRRGPIRGRRAVRRLVRHAERVAARLDASPGPARRCARTCSPAASR